MSAVRDMPQPAEMNDAFSKNRWFPVERSDHVPEGQVVLGVLHGQELALWRSADGEVHAWENRCPHRSVRLTLGFIVDDQLTCRYHGWRYGSDGRCTGIPSTPALAPPPAACATRFLCREVDGMVWASLALLPRGWPPRVGALAPCRSFVVDLAAPAAAVALQQAGFIAGETASVWHESDAAAGDDPATLLLLPVDDNSTCVHLLTAEGASSARRQATARRIKPLIARLTQPIEETADVD